MHIASRLVCCYYCIHMLTIERKKLLQELAGKYGTPLFIVDHDVIRGNYTEFRDKLSDVQAYFAVKSNSNPEIIKTMFDMGSSFDVASFFEFKQVYENIKDWPEKERQEFIWGKKI